MCDRAIIINQGKIVADSKVSDLKSTDDFQVIKLEFKHEVDIEPLRKLKGVLEVNVQEVGFYELKTDQQADLRSEIFSLAAKHDWPLVGLQQVQSSLEDVFKTLTQKEVKA